MMNCRTLVMPTVWLALAGCATYVNIPAQPGDFARHNPNDRVVQDVLVEAINAVVKAYPVDGQFALLLPESTTTKTYRRISKKVTGEAVWPGNRQRTELPILEVRQILIRRQEAKLDVVRSDIAPNGDAVQKVVTVELQWHPLQGWLTQRVRHWQVSMEDAFWTFEEDDDTD